MATATAEWKDEARMMWGGGFVDSFGYRLYRGPESSDPKVNIWQLYADPGGVLLETFSLPTDARISKDELFKRVMEGYDEVIAITYENLKRRAYRQRIQTYVDFGRMVEARAAYLAMRKAFPAEEAPSWFAESDPQEGREAAE